MDVPLEDQTRECLIALVEAMDKQAKDSEHKNFVIEELIKYAKKVSTNFFEDCGWDPEDSYSKEMVTRKGSDHIDLYDSIKAFDAIALAQDILK